MSRNAKQLLTLVGTIAVIGGAIYLYGKTTHQRPLIKVGAPLLSAAKEAQKKCRAGEVKRGDFCATPDYWAELDAGTPA